MEMIYEFKVQKEDRAKMLEDERAFLLSLGQAINEISCLSKLTFMAGNFPDGNQLTNNVGQTLVLLRVLVGKSYEAWKMFEAHSAKKQYRSPVSDEAKQALRSLRKNTERMRSI